MHEIKSNVAYNEIRVMHNSVQFCLAVQENFKENIWNFFFEFSHLRSSVDTGAGGGSQLLRY